MRSQCVGLMALVVLAVAGLGQTAVVPEAPTALVIEGTAMAPLLPLAALLQGALTEDVRTGTVTLTRGRRQFRCQPGSPTAFANRRAVPLPQPPFVRAQALYAPVAALAQALGGRATLDAAGASLTLAVPGRSLVLPCVPVENLATYNDGDAEHYLLNPDGTGLHRLTYDSRDEEALALAPDGRSVVFLYRNALYWRAADHPVARVLQATADRVELTAPSVSPDGQWVLYSECAPHVGWQVCRIRPDGTGKQVLAKGNAPYCSPDGAWIAFGMGSRSGPLVEQEIGLMRADGREARVIGIGVAPYAFSPDSAWLLYQRFVRSPSETRYYPRPMRYALATGETLPADPQAEFRSQQRGWGVFSPDGTHIAYLAAGQVMLARNDLTEVRPLTPDGMRPYPASSLLFTPDGRAVIFLYRDMLYQVALDGSAPVCLTNRVRCRAVSLLPDGRLLLLASPYPVE